MEVVIVLGVTSSLSGSVLNVLKGRKIYGFIRKRDDNEVSQRSKYRKDNLKGLVDIIEYDEDNLLKPLSSLVSLSKSSNRKIKVLNFLPHPMLDILGFLRDNGIDVLTIGSGAVVDWMKGKHTILSLSQKEETKPFGSYIEGKLLSEKLSTLTIHPGFFLPQDNTPFTWSGLHLKTCWELFAPVFDETLNWGKDKYVTPIDNLADLIKKWVIGELTSKRSSYVFGTIRSYPRWKLRELSGFNDVPGFIKIKYPESGGSGEYQNDMEETKRDLCDIPIDVKSACVQARNWVELHESSLHSMFDEN